jgi:S-adenosylhomocysteine hydrolase
MLDSLKAGAVVCNIGHFDTEIDTAYLRGYKWVEVSLKFTKCIVQKMKMITYPSF